MTTPEPMASATASDHSPPTPPPPPPPPPPFFPWDRLPISIQETILSLLPISTLILCKSVSRSLRSTLRSPSFVSLYPLQTLRRENRETLFLLFLNRDGAIDAFLPAENRWASLPLPPELASGLLSGGSLVLMRSDSNLVVLDPLTSRRWILPPMKPLSSPYAIALIETSPWHFKIVSVSNEDRILSQIYDSDSDRWELGGEFAGRFAVIASTTYLDGLLFCLSCGPERVLAFDPTGGEWSLVVDTMPPSTVFPHILSFHGGVFVVSCVEEVGVIARVGIWELDRSERKWRVVCFMSDELCRKFDNGELGYFETVDRAGKICVYNYKTDVVLMYDLSVRRWQCPPPRDVPMKARFWFGHAVEPHVGLLM